VFTWVYASKIEALSLSGTPIPVSDTLTSTIPALRSSLAEISILPLAVNLIALPRRLCSTWRIRSSSANTAGRSLLTELMISRGLSPARGSESFTTIPVSEYRSRLRRFRSIPSFCIFAMSSRSFTISASFCPLEVISERFSCAAGVSAPEVPASMDSDRPIIP